MFFSNKKSLKNLNQIHSFLPNLQTAHLSAAKPFPARWYGGKPVGMVWANSTLFNSYTKIQIKLFHSTPIVGVDPVTNNNVNVNNNNNSINTSNELPNTSNVVQDAINWQTPEDMQVRFFDPAAQAAHQNNLFNNEVSISHHASPSSLQQVSGEVMGGEKEIDALNSTDQSPFDTDNFMPSSTTYSESFKYFIDQDGKLINFNELVENVDAVVYVSRYLIEKYKLDPALIDKAKILDLVNYISLEKEIKVIDLYNYVRERVNKDPNYFSLLKESSNLKEGLILDKSNSQDSNMTDPMGERKPFGKFGDYTINQISVELTDRFQNLNMDRIINSVKVAADAAPLLTNTLSFTMILKTYLKFVHNRAYPSGITPNQLQVMRTVRERHLSLFCVFGIPLVMLAVKSMKPKDALSVTFSSEGVSTSSSLLINNESNLNKSSLFLIASKINKFIPNSFKVFIKLSLFILLIIKFLGFNYIDIFISTYYLKFIIYIIGISAINFQILNLYLLNKFSSKEVTIPSILPDFIINWLNEFKMICESKESINEFKKLYYIEILVYIIILVIVKSFF